MSAPCVPTALSVVFIGLRVAVLGRAGSAIFDSC